MAASLRVAINGLQLTRPYSGVGQYSYHLIQALAATHQLTVYVPEQVKIALPKQAKIKVVPPSRGRLPRGLALDHWETADVAKAINRSKADIYHTPYPTPPANLEIPVVMTVHDMIPWQFSAYRKGLRRRVKLGRTLAGIRTATHLVTVSQSAAGAIAKIGLLPESRITVAYEDIDPTQKRPAGKMAIADARKRHHLPRPYVFYVGGFDARKNVSGLISGFAKSGLAETHDLVLGGARSAPDTKLYADFSNLSHLTVSSGVNDQVRALGWLDQSDKWAIISGADCFVYPSLAEGFGLPILEALAVGTPVAASRIPSTEELFGTAVTMFEPDNPTQMAKTLRSVVRKPSRAKVTSGRKVAKQFSWDATARTVGQLYKKLA